MLFTTTAHKQWILLKAWPDERLLWESRHTHANSRYWVQIGRERSLSAERPLFQRTDVRTQGATGVG